MGIIISSLKPILAIVEPIVLGVMLVAFWYSSPTRDHRLWLLAFIPLIGLLRWLAYERLSTRTPMDGLLLAFIVLAIVNVYAAPFRRSPDVAYSFFTLMARPLLGIALYGYFVERAREQKSLKSLLIATLVLATIVVILALGASQWTSKSHVLNFIINRLPRITDGLAAFDARGGFNVNEIAGALAWLCPVVGGLIVYQWGRYHRVLRAVTAILFVLLFLALFLGQSRFALLGVLIALAGLVWALIPKGRGRWLAWGGLLVIAVLEVMIVRDVFTPPDQRTLATRDEDSMSIRFDIWGSAIHIIRDYPLTGVGMNMFRDGRVRELYPVPTFPNPVLPHAHQEWLQVGSDLGVPGLVVFIGLQAAVVYLVYKGLRQSDLSAKAVLAAAGFGLFAHAFFGLGDAIALWDRFAFIFWWLLGLVGAQAYLLSEPDGKNQL